MEDFLKIFDYTYDDIVIEKGENWVEKYYIKNIKSCDLKLPDGYKADIKALAKNSPPDYSFTDDQGFKYYFNVCRNTIMTCGGRDDGVAIQYGKGKIFKLFLYCLILQQ
jgi:hypothetical protein